MIKRPVRIEPTTYTKRYHCIITKGKNKGSKSWKESVVTELFITQEELNAAKEADND